MRSWIIVHCEAAPADGCCAQSSPERKVSRKFQRKTCIPRGRVTRSATESESRQAQLTAPIGCPSLAKICAHENARDNLARAVHSSTIVVCLKPSIESLSHSNTM